MMRKKSLIILLISLLIIFSLFSIVASVNADEKWEEGYYYQSHKAWFTYHYFNATVVDKYAVYPMNYIQYLINVDGTIFIMQTDTRESQEFYIGDKITIYGSAVNEKRNLRSYSLFDSKYHNKKFPRIHYGGKPTRLADGFVRGESSSTTSNVNTDRYTNSMRILKATIVSGENQDDQTNCTVLIGKCYAGESVKISVLYSYDGKNLNKGNKVDKTVSDSGKIKVLTLNGLTDYPDKAIITIYDSNGNKLDTQTVTLELNSEPQTFKFFNDPEYASNGAKFVGYAGDGTWANYYKDGHYYTVDGELIG